MNVGQKAGERALDVAESQPGDIRLSWLSITGDTDDRVVPPYSFKLVAALQHAQAGDAPVLLRAEIRGGHGGDKPTMNRIEEVVDQSCSYRIVSRRELLALKLP